MTFTPMVNGWLHTDVKLMVPQILDSTNNPVSLQEASNYTWDV